MSLDEEFEQLVLHYNNDNWYKTGFIRDVKKFELLLSVDRKALKNENVYDLYYFIGKDHFLMKKYEESIGYLDKAWLMIPKLNALNEEKIRELKFQVRCLQGHVYVGKKDGDNALISFKECMYWGVPKKTISNELGLYSFRTINNFFLQDLINDELTVVNPELFNDPLDSPILSILRRDRDEEDLLYGVLDKVYRFFNIRCFVKEGEDAIGCLNFLMWSHYADNHKGVCVKYRFNEKFIIDDYSLLKTSCFKEVMYKTSLTTRKFQLVESFATKKSDWVYENEVRLIYYDPTCKQDFKSISLGDGAKIEAIYFGFRCSKSDRKTIKKLLGNSVDYYEIIESKDDYLSIEAVPC